MSVLLKDNSLDLREDILESVKNEINRITGNNISEPVNILGISIDDSYGGKLRIHNVFIDNYNLLCGDLTALNCYNCNGLIFGRNIEDLYENDLKRIFNKLTRISKIDEDLNDVSETEIIENPNVKSDKIKKYLNMFRLNKRGA